MHLATSATTEVRDAVATAALVVIRRALVEGVPVTRARLAQEAAVALGAPPETALAEVDAVAQRLGVSGLRSRATRGPLMRCPLARPRVRRAGSHASAAASGPAVEREPFPSG